MSSPAGGAQLSPQSSGQSIRDQFERLRNHVGVLGRSRSSSGSSIGSQNPTTNWIVNIGSVVGSVGGTKVTYKSNRPHGGFGNLLVSMGTQAGSIGGYHHIRSESQRIRQQQLESMPAVVEPSHRYSGTAFSNESFYTTASTPDDPGEVGLRRGSNASDDSFPGARLFVRQLSAYLAQPDPDRDSLIICEDSSSLHDDTAVDDTASVLSASDEEKLEELGFFNFNAEAPTSSAYLYEEHDIRNVVDIAAYPREDDEPTVRMRALLDTGNNGPNMMKESLARLTGHSIERLPEGFNYYPTVGNGDSMEAVGIVRVRWYFSERISQPRSYDIKFLVVPDYVPFDVVLGFRFLQAEHIFTMHSLFAMGGGQLIPGAGAEARRLADEAARRRREEQARRRREEEARRRAEARARAQRGGGTTGGGSSSRTSH